MDAPTLSTTLLATQEMMSSVFQQPMLTPVFKALDPEESRFFADLAEIAAQLIEDSVPEDINSLHRIGVACRLCGYLELAEMFYSRAFDLAAATYGENSLESSMHRNFLAALYFIWQKMVSAQTLSKPRQKSMKKNWDRLIFILAWHILA